jgi:hypothetical protein
LIVNYTSESTRVFAIDLNTFDIFNKVLKRAAEYVFEMQHIREPLKENLYFSDSDDNEDEDRPATRPSASSGSADQL